jgi:diguanylate cyclase (GGDEF)-like protein
LRCVLGWHHAEHGRSDEAARLVDAGAAAVADATEPTWRSFALWMRVRLHNRAAAEEARTAAVRYHAALESRLRTVTPSSPMIVVDIDRFKPVNDRFGHDAGDRVLRRVGRILLDCIRRGDLAARLGGDEFVVVLDAADRDVALRRAYEVRDRVRSEPWSHLRDGLRIAVSVGVAWGARAGDELYREADVALYEAKRACGAHVRASWAPRMADRGSDAPVSGG